jgi:hypothetical protein
MTKKWSLPYSTLPIFFTAAIPRKLFVFVETT